MVWRRLENFKMLLKHGNGWRLINSMANYINVFHRKKCLYME